MKQLASFAQKALNDPRLTYQVSVSLIRIISGGLGELVGPCVDDRVAINILDTSRDARPELLFRGHPLCGAEPSGRRSPLPLARGRSGGLSRHLHEAGSP